MAKALVHAQASARRFGGVVEDYLPIHDFLDSSKAVLADNRHRALTHNAWFLAVVLERVFGHTIANADGRQVSVRDVAEQHVMEDLGFIPSAQDYLDQMQYQDWMHGHGRPAGAPVLRPQAHTASEAGAAKRENVTIKIPYSKIND